MATNNSINQPATQPVAGGGTGVASVVAYTPLCGGTTTTGAFQSVASLGSSGTVLTSNGASALPTFQAVPGGATAAVKSDEVTGTSTTVFTNPGVQQFHNSAAKAWVKYDQTGASIAASYNVTSVTSSSTGKFVVNFTTNFAGVSYAFSGNCENRSANNIFMVQDTGVSPTVSALAVITIDTSGTVRNTVNYMSFFGVQ